MARCITFLALVLSAYAIAAGAELPGIWMGEALGRNGEKQDVAFQFKRVNGVLSGVMFGEEFDLPVQDLRMEGGKVSFSVTTTNYYSGSRVAMTYTGTVSEVELQLTRARKDPPADPPANDRQNARQTLTLKRVTP